ncbi:helix-turn-helix domain-containing protein [Verrucosispora sp. TAA-831]|uniref:helix-turn-helix domain-containing protein n=1 Tax=Verrucosispora sp. TAA-831 TaxID=3422227 RepID=UPI003D6F4692
MSWHADPDLGSFAYRHPRRFATVIPGPPPGRPDGTRLRQWRRESRMTQRELAGRVGAQRGDVGRWERGETPVPARVLTLLGLATQIRQAAK